MKTLTSAERLIVAADFKPSSSQGRDWVLEQVLGLANDLKGTGVCLKVNSALRLCGHGLINEIHDRGLAVFTDLKLGQNDDRASDRPQRADRLPAHLDEITDAADIDYRAVIQNFRQNSGKAGNHRAVRWSSGVFERPTAECASERL